MDIIVTLRVSDKWNETLDIDKVKEVIENRIAECTSWYYEFLGDDGQEYIKTFSVEYIPSELIDAI